MSSLDFMLGWDEHEKSFITSGPDVRPYNLETILCFPRGYAHPHSTTLSPLLIAVPEL